MFVCMQCVRESSTMPDQALVLCTLSAPLLGVFRRMNLKSVGSLLCGMFSKFEILRVYNS